MLAFPIVELIYFDVGTLGGRRGGGEKGRRERERRGRERKTRERERERERERAEEGKI